MSSFIFPRWRNFLLFIGLAFAGFNSEADAQTIPAFPGAAGYGGYAKGGRGGDVYHVTNLNNSGAGSFADAIATVPVNGRTIVFDVSGHIHLPSGSNLRLTKNKVTIAGQTAPGDGIGFKDGTFLVSSDDVVVRHVRFRYRRQAGGGDCLNLDSNSINTIFDHISMQFSTDENMSSFSSPPENVTLQWALNAWGLESHSCGGLWDQNHATAHHTLWAHHHTRNPKARPAGLLDWINNVTFDWDIGFIMGDSETPADWKANVRGNYFICPPGNIRSVALEKANIDRNGNRNFTIFVENNLFDKNGNAVLDGTDVGYGIASGSYITAPAALPNTGSAPFVIDPPLVAYKKIVSNAGALRMDASAGIPLRDEVDTILINNLVTLRRNHISSETATGASNGGIGTLNSAPPPVDSDRDGMPDFWEVALGANPAVGDHNTAFPSSGGTITGTTFFPPNTPAGYTYLEEYLHFRASPHAVVAKNTATDPSAVDIDLRRYTSGFSVSPVFSVPGSSVVGGTVTQSGSGNAVARFVPTQNFVGRAKFDFAVQDAAGNQWTQSFYLLVSSSGVPRDLVWIGNGTTNVWDTSSTLWGRNGTPTAFGPGDFALFDDRGSASPAISLTTSVAAGAVTVDAVKNYTFGGAGGLAGGTLTKRGPGSLTLENTSANTFSSVSLDEGALVALNSTALGSGTIELNGGTLTLAPSVVGSTVPNALAVNGDAAVNVTTQHNIGGPWTGSGTLNVNTTALWTIVSNTSGFAGRVNLGSGASNLRLNGSLGSVAATWDLGAGTGRLQNRNGNVTIDLGALAGGSGTQLLGAQSVDAASTYSIGALGSDMTFAGSIKDGTAGANAKTNIVKIGAGTLALTGSNTFTGTATVNAGTLLAIGSLPGAIVVNSGGKFSPGSTPGQAATLATGGLTLAAGTLVYDLSNTPTGANDRITVASGTLALSGAVNFQLNLNNGALGPGTYPLIDGGATLAVTSGMVMTPVLPAPAGTTRQTFALQRPASGTTPGYVNLTVTGNAAALSWTGAGGGVWDLNTTPNNWSGGATSTFYNLDTVQFTDSTANGTVTLSGTVQPLVLNVSNAATAYSLTGNGTLSGGGRLVKSGAGTLTISNTGGNTFTGGTVLNAGSLVLTNPTSPLGTGVITVNGGTLRLPDVSASLNNSMVFSGLSAIACSYTGNSTIVGSTSGTMTSSANTTVDLRGIAGILTIGGDMSGFDGTLSFGPGSGMLRLNGNVNANTGSATTLFDLGIGTARLANRNGDTTINLGALQGGPGTVLQGRQSGGADTTSTYVVGALNTDNLFAGAIVTGGDLGGVNIVKVGTGTWSLSGTSNFVGALAIDQGNLALSGSFTCTGGVGVRSGATLGLNGTLACEIVNVAAGAQLTGSGTIQGDLINQGTVTCGTGTLTIVGDVVNDGTMRFTGGSRIAANAGFVNNGVLDLLTGTQSLPPNLENNGVILDSSLVRVASANHSGANFTVTIRGYTGHNYQLQLTDTLAGTWTNVGPAQAGNGSVLTFTDSTATGRQRFYRVAVFP